MVLYILRALGVFYICRKWIANKTLVLAYHGFEIDDECQFRDQLFIKADTLKRRLKYLEKHCHVVSLNDYEQHGPQKNKVVITIDDGWYSTLSVAAPIFNEIQMPYTVYLTTENVLDNQPIFHVALSYILHRNVGKYLSYSNENGLRIEQTITTENMPDIVESFTPAKREKNDTMLLRDVARCLNFDFNPTIENKALTLMSVKQTQAIQKLGADIQLHTHTHDTPLNSYELFAEEINVNRDHITAITGIKPEHHCYPSGVYNTDSFGHLNRLGVKTATTCYPGLCDRQTNPMEIPRFLDSERIEQIVFEAEVSGVSELLRKLFKRGGNPNEHVQAISNNTAMAETVNTTS